MIDLNPGMICHYEKIPEHREQPLKTEQDDELAQQQALNRFLADIEKRAFRMAEIATGNSLDALDLVWSGAGCDAWPGKKLWPQKSS